MSSSHQEVNGFTEFRVEVDPSKELMASKKAINIVLAPYIDPKRLPYSEEYDEKKLNEYKAERLNNCMVVARGDIHSPKEIFESGGFHPKYVSPKSPAKKQVQVMDVMSHRVSSEGSGLVSSTNDIEVAKNFACDRTHTGYVYMLKATGAIGPSSLITTGEKEYSLPGGVDADAVIAFRKMDPESPLDFGGSSIFVSNDFIKKYPQHVAALVSNYLQSNERCLDMHLLPKMSIAAITVGLSINSSALQNTSASVKEQPQPKSEEKDASNENVETSSPQTVSWDEKEYEEERKNYKRFGG